MRRIRSFAEQPRQICGTASATKKPGGRVDQVDGLTRPRQSPPALAGARSERVDEAGRRPIDADVEVVGVVATGNDLPAVDGADPGAVAGDLRAGEHRDR